ncbi:MAG: substrate-binding domain-containing protein [Clostridia bacterium]|nr:substrate-binding domain-containing protein [Clostridia bacterium]
MKKIGKIIACTLVAAAAISSVAALSACSDEEEVKTLSYNGVECTTENIENGSYSLSRPFNLVYQTDNLSAVAQTFLDWMQTSDAISIIQSEGYVNSSSGITQTTSTYTGSITLSGSTSVYPLMEVLAEKYMELHSGVTITVNGGGSGVGLSDSVAGNNDIGMISKAFDATTYTTLSYVNLCTDGIALIVNANCSVTNVTKAELAALYTSGTAIQSTITTAIGRDSGSGTRSAFDELVGIEGSYVSGTSELAETGNVISLIQSNTAGDTIGYVSAGSI